MGTAIGCGAVSVEDSLELVPSIVDHSFEFVDVAEIELLGFALKFIDGSFEFGLGLGADRNLAAALVTVLLVELHGLGGGGSNGKNCGNLNEFHLRILTGLVLIIIATINSGLKAESKMLRIKPLFG